MKDVRAVEEKEMLMQMLTEASHSYRIKAVVWALEEYNSQTRPYPVLIIDYAKDICKHLIEWSGNKPDGYFTLVWRQNEKGYDLALLPNFEKSARRYHQLTGNRQTLTILGHIFLYQASSSFNINELRDRPKVRLGFAEDVLSDGSLTNYHEVTVRCQAFENMLDEDRKTLEQYWLV